MIPAPPVPELTTDCPVLIGLDEVVNAVEGRSPRSIRQIIADDQRRRPIRVRLVADEDDRIVDITKGGTPQQVRYEGEFFEGPEIVVENLPPPLVGDPDNHPRSLPVQLVQQAGQLPGSFGALEKVELDGSHDR